ncbi:MAG: hypothetical protein DMD79_15965, partial [Candidatus Rokuibacteriota bacterium]
FVDFPLRPLQALTNGGAARSLAAMLGFLRARLRPARARNARDFGTWASATFGRGVAEAFLIPFSEKLWGLPAGELSPDIAGRRLPGFSLSGIAREVLFGQKAHHLEGRFLYPRHGYGQIVDAMAARLTPGRLRCGARVTRLRVEKDGVRAVEYESDGRRRIIEPAAVANGWWTPGRPRRCASPPIASDSGTSSSWPSFSISPRSATRCAPTSPSASSRSPAPTSPATAATR